MTISSNVQVLCIPSATLGNQFFAAPSNMPNAKTSLEEIVRAFNMDDGRADETPNLVSLHDFAAAYSFLKVDAAFAHRFQKPVQTCGVSL